MGHPAIKDSLHPRFENGAGIQIAFSFVFVRPSTLLPIGFSNKERDLLNQLLILSRNPGR